MSILVTGSIAIDHIMVFEDRFKNHILPDKIHILNVSFLVPALKRSFGGTAGNIAYGLRLLGEDPLVLGTVGRDFQPYAQWMDQHGVRRDAIKVLDDELTAQAFVTTDLDDNQITAFHPGAMARAHEARLEDLQAKFSVGIVSPNGKQAMIDLARGLKARGVPAVIDPGQAMPLFQGPDLIEMIQGADSYIVNDYEWAMTLATTGMTEREVASAVKTLVITLGDQGSRIIENGMTHEIPSVKAERVVDPTGCGDAYRAGFLFGRARGLAAERCAQLGSLMGSLKVAQPGPQSVCITLAEFRQRFETEFGATF